MSNLIPLADLLCDAEVFTDGDWVETKDQDPEGDVRLTQLADVGDGEWINKSARFLTSEKAKQLKCTYLRLGDLLVARMPDPLGRCCVFPGDSMPCVTVVDVCVIRPNQHRVDNRYLMHVINAPHGRRRIARHMTGTTRRRISRRNLSKVEILLPSLAEQKRIAGILDAADALRAKRREALGQLDSLLQSTFLDMFGDPVTNPMGWTKVRSGELFLLPPKIGTITPAAGRGYLVVRVGEVGESRIAFERCGRVDISEKDFAKFRLERGDTVIARAIGSKNHLGKASFFADFDEATVIDSHVMRLRPDPIKCDGLWLYSLISSDRGKILLQQSGGATAVQFNINANQASSVQVALPPLDLQHRFAAIVESVEQQKARQRAHLAELDTLFACLQSRAFRGDL